MRARCRPCCPAGVRSPTRARAPRSSAPGRSACPTTPGRDTDAILRAATDGALAALVVGGVDPGDLAHPALRRRGARTGRLHRQPGGPAQRRHRARRRRLAGGPARREGRRATSPGKAGADRSTSPCTAPARSPTPGCCTRWPRNSTSICACLMSRRPAANWSASACGTARVAPPAVAPAAAPAPESGEAVLATWHELLDAGRMSGRRREPGRHREARPGAAIGGHCRRDRHRRGRADQRRERARLGGRARRDRRPARPRRLAAHQRPRLRATGKRSARWAAISSRSPGSVRRRSSASEVTRERSGSSGGAGRCPASAASRSGSS